MPSKPKFKNHECHLLTEEEEDEVIKQFIDTGIFIGIRRKFRSWCVISKEHPLSPKYFKSDSSRRYEKIRHLLHHYYMIHPLGIFSLYWEFYMFIIFMIYYFSIPMSTSQAVTGNLEQQEFRNFDFFLSALHIMDVVKLFFTGYYNIYRSKVMLNFSDVAKNYVRTFFIFDLLSCGQFFIYIIMQAFPVLRQPRITFPIRLLNRVKIVRLPRCLHTLDLFRKYLGFSSYQFKGIQVFCTFIVVVFWAYSIIFFVHTCLHLYSEGHVNVNETVYAHYYHATQMLLMVTYTKQHHLEMLEYGNIIFFLFFGYILQLFLYAQVLQVWVKYSSSENQYHSLHKQFEEYMNYKELPLSLRDRIFSYFQFKFNNQFFRESDIHSMVSPILKQEILMHVTRNHIERVEFFKHLPENILMKVVSQLKTEIFLPGDVIISAGTAGSTMFFIYHGTVAVYTPMGKEICHLEDGAHFGEIALILSQTRVATVVAISASELFMLRRPDFLAAIEPFPEFRDQLVALATERLHKAMMQSEDD